jgi:hypothetical protein
MHAIDPLHADLARARDIGRWQTARRARQMRDARVQAHRPRWTGSWSVLSLAVVLGLALAVGTVTASRAGYGERDAAGPATPGAVIAADAKASGVSVAVVIQTSAIDTDPVPGRGAPGKAGTGVPLGAS